MLVVPGYRKGDEAMDTVFPTVTGRSGAGS